MDIYRIEVVYDPTIVTLSCSPGEGLIVASQPKWGRHRKLLNAAFHKRALGGYRDKMEHTATAFIDKLLGKNMQTNFIITGQYRLSELNTADYLPNRLIYHQWFINHSN